MSIKLSDRLYWLSSMDEQYGFEGFAKWVTEAADKIRKIESICASLPTRIETHHLGDYTLDEIDAYDAGYNDALKRCRNLLNFSSPQVEQDDEVLTGDYVLATEYSDGAPYDPWEVGFYDGERDGRHHVVDEKGSTSRLNGYRRVLKITPQEGEWLLGQDWYSGRGWVSLYDLLMRHRKGELG